MVVALRLLERCTSHGLESIARACCLAVKQSQLSKLVTCQSDTIYSPCPILHENECCSQAMDSMTAQQAISAHVRMTEAGIYDSYPWTLFHLLPFWCGENEKTIEFKDVQKWHGQATITYYNTVLMTLALWIPASETHCLFQHVIQWSCQTVRPCPSNLGLRSLGDLFGFSCWAKNPRCSSNLSLVPRPVPCK